jgi:O-acetylhomoserine (thiol)-lyase
LKEFGKTTQLVHADKSLNPQIDGAVHSPANQSVLFEFQDAQDIVDAFQGKIAAHVYSRSSSSTNTSLQNVMNHLEQGIGAVTFATGMAAISTVMLSLLKYGDHIIVSDFLFGNTRSFFKHLQKLGIEVSFVDVTDVQHVVNAKQPNTVLVFCESLSNPMTHIADLSAIGKYCQGQQLLYIVDNTMSPSVIFSAKDAGASLVISSLTKYVSGHGQVLGGSVVDTGLFDWRHYANVEPMYQVGDSAQWGLTQIRKKGLRDMGATLPAPSASTILVGLETLDLRYQKACENARKLAQHFMNHPKIKQVFYPGLASHPQHFLARDHFSSYGALMSIELPEGEDIIQFINRLNLVICSTHLGDTRTLAIPVAQTIFFEATQVERDRTGITDQIVRLSIGIEDVDDLIADFEQALNA